MANNKLTVSIKSSEKTVWEGEADSVSSINSQGPFDILPLHSNFISVIDNKPIIVRQGREKKEFQFAFGVIYAHTNSVQIYINL